MVWLSFLQKKSIIIITTKREYNFTERPADKSIILLVKSIWLPLENRFTHNLALERGLLVSRDVFCLPFDGFAKCGEMWSFCGRRRFFVAQNDTYYSIGWNDKRELRIKSSCSAEREPQNILRHKATMQIFWFYCTIL